MSADPRLSTCTLCPRLCRTACPVATGTGREAAVPAVMAGALREWGEGRLPPEVAAEAAALCVDCGACRAHCHLDRPLPEALADAREELRAHYPARAPEPVARIEGSATAVAVVTDDRPWPDVLARVLGSAVAVWRTGDRLGAATGFRAPPEHLAAVRAAADGRRLIVADGGSAEILSSAGVPFAWLHAVVPGLSAGAGSCRSGGARPLACCGGAGPLPVVHPVDAARVGRAWAARRETAHGCDSRCRDHLRSLGEPTTDAVDALLAGLP